MIDETHPAFEDVAATTPEQDRVLLAIAPVIQKWMVVWFDTLIEETGVSRLELEQAMDFFVSEGIINSDLADHEGVEKYCYVLSPDGDVAIARAKATIQGRKFGDNPAIIIESSAPTAEKVAAIVDQDDHNRAVDALLHPGRGLHD